MKKLLMAGIGALAILAPGAVFAQSLPSLTTSPSSTDADVTTTVAAGCAITGTLSPIAVTVPLNGGSVTPATSNAGTITITCNTPKGAVSIGSNPLKNAAAIDPAETGTFTNEIDFAGVALRTDENDWRLASRVNTANGAWQSAFLDANVANTRIQTLTISARDFSTVGKLPVAGSYAGLICVTVNPTGTPLSTQADATCDS
jgi:hypothetical protein